MNSNLLPVFSVITVTYNAEAVIKVTIESVLAQTYPHIEYIVIDGASKDNTLTIINRYRDQLQTVLSEPDNGLYDAMNKGIRMAIGDYVCFLNAGDTFRDNDTLELMVKSFEGKYTAFPDILYGETAIVDKARNFLHMRRLAVPEKLTWKSFKQGMLVCHQAFFVRRDLVEPYDLSYRFSSDFDWCIRMMKKSDSIYNTHLILIDYLRGGVTTENHRKSLKERFAIMVKYYGRMSTIFYHICFIVRCVRKNSVFICLLF